jgi:hypothetical protein
MYFQVALSVEKVALFSLGFNSAQCIPTLILAAIFTARYLQSLAALPLIA